MNANIKLLAAILIMTLFPFPIQIESKLLQLLFKYHVKGELW